MKYRELSDEDRAKVRSGESDLGCCDRCLEVVEKEKLINRSIRANRKDIMMAFCSNRCAANEQMACEG